MTVELKECPACGCPEPERLTTCPHCENYKCDACDMGDDVECPACLDDDGDWDDDPDFD